MDIDGRIFLSIEVRTFKNFQNKCPVILLSEFSGIFKMNIYKYLLVNIHECHLVNVHVHSL